MEELKQLILLIKNIGFIRGWALYALIIPILMFIYHLFISRKRTLTMNASSLIWREGIRNTLRTRLRNLPFFIRLLAISMLIIAFAGPYTSLSWEKISKEGIDIMIVLDVSGSMLAQDFKPNRIEAAKAEAINFIKGRPSDRFGLVIFSRDAITQCPLTYDHSAVISLINKIKHGYLDDGTAIGMGIATALARLQESNAKSRVIILLTDGVNNAGEISPLTAGQMAKEMGVKIYSIGIGTRGVAPYPIPTPMGIVYQNMPVEIDEALLQEISSNTGGKYFRATDNQKLREIYAEIDKMEKAKIETHQYQQKNELFVIPATAGLLFLFLEIAIRSLYIRKPFTW